MAMLAPAVHDPSSPSSRLLARHRAETERELDSVRTNAFLDDRDRARQITEIVAEANAGVLALAATGPHACPVQGCHA
jgi:hypothetical protein